MTGFGRTGKRSMVLGAAAVVVFVGALMARPEPAAPGGAAAAASQDEAMPEGSFAVTGAKVFDGEAFRPDQDVWVEDGRVRAVGAGLDLPDGVARVDGGGRTLVPGLIDGHAHTFGSTLSDAVRFGVTSVLDQFTHPALAGSKRAARETLARGDEADLFTAGMLATAAGGHGTQFGVPVEPVVGPADAADWVRARKAEGSDWIKIAYEDGSTYGADIPSLDAGTIRALIAAAHAEGLLAVVHVSTLAHALEVVDLGADGLVHVWGDAVVDETQAARIAEAGAFVVPTLSVVTAMSGDGIGRELLEDAGGAPLSRMQRETLANRYPDQARSTVPARGATAIENVRRLHAAGVRLLAGTDAPNPGTAPGISMHGELRLLTRAGQSSAEALAAATATPADIFGLDDRGRIEAGRIADLVLVDGDLEADVSASTRIAAVWKDGYRVKRGIDEGASTVPAAPDTTLISDFEAGVGASFGVGWQVTTDQLQGGASTAALSASEGALRVEGDVVASGSAFPWSGAIYFPGAQPMQPVDFSGREMLRFRVRGDGRSYLVMLFSGGAAAAAPPSVPFTAPEGWTVVAIPLARFPAATPGLVGGLAFVATTPAGAFAFELDDVEIR